MTIEFDPETMELIIFTNEDYDEEEYCTAFNTLSNLKGIESLKSVVISDIETSPKAKTALNNFLNTISNTTKFFHKSHNPKQ